MTKTDVTTIKEPEVKPWEPTSDDLVCVILRTWGDPQKCVPGRVTYLDRVAFTSGVARNVEIDVAKQWVKHGLVPKEHLLPNDASEQDFVRVTGCNPLASTTPQTLHDAMEALLSDPEKIAGLLGDEDALRLAKALHNLSSRRKGQL